MLKKFLGLIAILIVTVIAVINVNVDLRKSGMSDLSLANVEALAGFEFNGQYWDDEDHWYNNVGNNWKPVLQDCTSITYLMGDCVAWDNSFNCIMWQKTDVMLPGQQVHCVSGSGNCLFGTDCIPINN